MDKTKYLPRLDAEMSRLILHQKILHNLESSARTSNQSVSIPVQLPSPPLNSRSSALPPRNPPRNPPHKPAISARTSNQPQCSHQHGFLLCRSNSRPRELCARSTSIPDCWLLLSVSRPRRTQRATNLGRAQTPIMSCSSGRVSRLRYQRRDSSSRWRPRCQRATCPKRRQRPTWIHIKHYALYIEEDVLEK